MCATPGVWAGGLEAFQCYIITLTDNCQAIYRKKHTRTTYSWIAERLHKGTIAQRNEQPVVY
jgi:hypothetical protein